MCLHTRAQERGPILEIIVSRMRYIASQTAQTVRMVGLSTAMANAHDISDWLDIPPDSLFNFKPSVRPVPLEARAHVAACPAPPHSRMRGPLLEPSVRPVPLGSRTPCLLRLSIDMHMHAQVHIAGFPGKHYCPRMATMNKPTYRAILNHSPTKPALVFVSSRRQTRLTALDLIAYCSADERESQFLRMTPHALAPLLEQVKDPNPNPNPDPNPDPNPNPNPNPDPDPTPNPNPNPDPDPNPYQATRLFASNMNPRMAQRFFNLVLLPAVQVRLRVRVRARVRVRVRVRVIGLGPGLRSGLGLGLGLGLLLAS